MSIELLFWVLYIVALVFGFWVEYVPGQPYPMRRVPGALLFFVLVGLLGWKVFGPAIRT